MSYEVITGFGEFNGDKYYKVTTIKDPLTFEWRREYYVTQDAITKFTPYIKEFSFESTGTQTEEIYEEQESESLNKFVEEIPKKEEKTAKMPAQKSIFPQLKDYRESRKIKYTYKPLKILAVDAQNNNVIVSYPDSSESITIPYSEAIMVFPNLIAEYFLKTVVNHWYFHCLCLFKNKETCFIIIFVYS